MKFDSIDFNLILLSSMWLIAGIIATWFYMKKTILSQSLENQNAQISLRDLLEKNEALLMEKMELDKQLNFGFAKESQVKQMYRKFFKKNSEEDCDNFYKQIKGLNFTTAMIQQYFIWHMFDSANLIEDISEFKDICSKHNYEKKLDLYM